MNGALRIQSAFCAPHSGAGGVCGLGMQGRPGSCLASIASPPVVNLSA